MGPKEWSPREHWAVPGSMYRGWTLLPRRLGTVWGVLGSRALPDS